MSEGTPIVEVRRRGRIREARGHDGITFDLETGELSGSLGRSGVGRAATIQLLSAVLGATSDGVPLAAARRRRTGGRR